MKISLSAAAVDTETKEKNCLDILRRQRVNKVAVQARSEEESFLSKDLDRSTEETLKK